MKYGFIGCGNMGGALAKALIKSTNSILLSDPSPSAQALADELGCQLVSNEYAALNCDRLFLAVKPQVMSAVLAPLQVILREQKPLLITIAAGLEISKIESFVGCRLPIIRIMPNTPVAVGKGMITYCANDLVSEEMMKDFLQDMEFAGCMDQLPEKLIDAASALAGCGPAFMYMFMEALADGAVACGLPRQNAISYAANTMIGAAQMVLETGMHPGTLKDNVCSPGGSTIEGVKVLEEHGLRGAVMDCITAAYKRSQELGK